LHLSKQQEHKDEVEETIKMLKQNEGFHSLVIVKCDGVVVKWENMTYDHAKQWAYNALDLTVHTQKVLSGTPPLITNILYAHCSLAQSC
jgi:hypothetical protein